jgi:hypothetical protein
MNAAVARYIGSLQDHGGLKGTDIANFTDVSSATVHRWKAVRMFRIPRPSCCSLSSTNCQPVGRLLHG